MDPHRVVSVNSRLPSRKAALVHLSSHGGLAKENRREVGKSEIATLEGWN